MLHIFTSFSSYIFMSSSSTITSLLLDYDVLLIHHNQVVSYFILLRLSWINSDRLLMSKEMVHHCWPTLNFSKFTSVAVWTKDWSRLRRWARATGREQEGRLCQTGQRSTSSHWLSKRSPGTWHCWHVQVIGWHSCLTARDLRNYRSTAH